MHSWSGVGAPYGPAPFRHQLTNMLGTPFLPKVEELFLTPGILREALRDLSVA